MSLVGEKLKRKKTTAADLPEEIIRKEILTRLPIKYVVRFKSVSKSWLSLFSNRQFVQDHFTRCAAHNPNDYDCLVARKHNGIVILSRYKETSVLPCDQIALIGSIRGLICLRNDQRLSLWNPAINQSMEFYIPPDHFCTYAYNNIGFGFDPVSNDYKVVVLSSDLRSATVYISNSNSWIDASVPDLVFLNNRRKHYAIPIVKDCPHWIFAKYMEDKHPYIEQLTVWTAVSLIAVKFDAGSNEFKLLPEFNIDISSRGEKYAFSYESVDMNDCLTLMVYDKNSANSVVDIYSLDGEEGCCVWSKMYSIGPVDFHTRNWYVFLSQGFKYGSEIVFLDDGMFSCYDYETNTVKCLVSTTTSITPVASCFRYTPSLVFLEGMKSVHLTAQTRRTSGLSYRTPQRLINSLRDRSFAKVIWQC